MGIRSSNGSGKILLGVFLLLGISALLLYLNREKLIPQVKEVKYLRVELASDTALVRAGLQVQNYAPVPFRIDSVNYIIRNNGKKLGWGGQVVGKTLAPFGNRVLDFRLFLDTEKYREHLARQQGQDSLELDVAMAVYFDLPLMDPRTLTLNRTVKTPIPKAPAFQIDTLLVQSFKPKQGYTFLLQLNTGNTNLPHLRISDLEYEVLFADNTYINGKVDSTFTIPEGQQTVQVPIKLETAEVVELIRKKLRGKKRWHYQAKAAAIVQSDHPLFQELKVTVSKTGSFDASGLGGDELAMPSVKRIKNLELSRQEKNTYLNANLLIQNPSQLPLYIDSARYTVRHQGKLIAQGGLNYEKKLPANGTQELQVQLAVNNDRYREMMQQVKGQNEIPLEVKLDLIYDLKDHPRQRITIKRNITAPVPESGGIEVAGLDLKELDPAKGAHLLLNLKVQNNQLSGLQVDNLNYNVVIGKDLELSGRTTEPLRIEKGISEVAIPLKLSAADVNLLVRRLLQGTQDWNYRLNGAAVLTSDNGMLQNTRIALQTTGELETNGSNSGKLMPAITRFDTLGITIHYDSAWVRGHLYIHNPLPVALNVQELNLEVAHTKTPFGKIHETRTHVLPANSTEAVWLDMSVDYARWDQHVVRHQDEDSLKLSIPIELTLSIGNLEPQTVPIRIDTKIPMPYTPVTILQKSKFGGFSKAGLKFNGDVLVQNANVKDLEISGVEYQIELENGVDMCGKINRTYHIPLDQSHLQFPFSLSLGEAVSMLTRQFFGPPKLHYKINATAQISTDSPKMQNVYLIFENHNVTDLKQKKEPSPRIKKQPAQQPVVRK